MSSCGDAQEGTVIGLIFRLGKNPQAQPNSNNNNNNNNNKKPNSTGEGCLTVRVQIRESWEEQLIRKWRD